MKKFFSVLMVLLFFSLFQISNVKAEGLTNEQKTQLKTQVRERKQTISKNTAANKKLELSIDERSEELVKVIMMLFDKEFPPNEEKLFQIEGKEETLVKNAEQIAKLKRTIKNLRKESNISINELNYAEALEKLDKVILLQEDEAKLLMAFGNNMEDLIELIKSLQYK